MDRPLAWSRVASARVASLATIGADGSAHLVPCVLALAEDVAYTPVDAKPKRTRSLQRLADIARDPRVVVLVHNWVEDWAQLWWVRLQGRARTVSAAAELEAARRLLLEKYAQYRDARELDPVIAIDIESWRAWSASSKR
jgi:PPOX class probable F420-dependent enzyme